MTDESDRVDDRLDDTYTDNCSMDQEDESEEEEEEETERTGHKRTRKQGGRGSRASKCSKAGAAGGGGEDGPGGGGQAVGPGDPAYYWHPDCRRNGERWRAMMKGSERWSRSDKAAVLKTGGVEGVVAMMGAGSVGSEWNIQVDSWVKGLRGSSQGSAGDSSVVGLLRACEEAVQAGVASDFHNMIRHIQLLLAVYQ